jgi:predicted nucleic acid-binding protein
VVVASQLLAARIRRHLAPLGGGRPQVILVDTSIWIDHLHLAEPRLVSLLTDDEIGCHHLVVEELALGSMKQRDVVLGLLSDLYKFPAVTHVEVLHLVEHRRLWGRGLSATDVNLIGSVALVDGAQLWTRDKRLKSICAEVGVALLDES